MKAAADINYQATQWQLTWKQAERQGLSKNLSALGKAATRCRQSRA